MRRCAKCPRRLSQAGGHGHSPFVYAVELQQSVVQLQPEAMLGLLVQGALSSDLKTRSLAVSYTSRAAYELDGALKLIHEFECFSSDMVGQAGIDDAPQASPFDLARCVGLEVEYRLGRAQDCVRFWVLDE